MTFDEWWQGAGDTWKQCTGEEEIARAAWETMEAEANRLRAENEQWWEDFRIQNKCIADQHTELAKLRTEVAELRAALSKINDIRNSIIAHQNVNFSEHVYPLVAALNAAGLSGMPYPEAIANYGTVTERAVKAEAENERLRADLAACEKNMLHAIAEKSRMKDHLTACNSANVSIARDNAELRDALQFYADESNYRGGFDNDGEGHFDQWGYNILDDGGATARKALEQTK